MKHRTLILISTLTLVAPVGGCVTEEEPLRLTFSNLPGAVNGSALAPAPKADGIDNNPYQSDPIQEDEDGEIAIRARNGAELIRVIIWALAEDQREVFTNQILSDITYNEFIDRGLDPSDAFDMLKQHERDIRALYARMPQAELTPGATFRKIDRNMFRVTPQAKRDLRWTSMDMVFRRGVWTLRWFG